MSVRQVPVIHRRCSRCGRPHRDRRFFREGSRYEDGSAHPSITALPVGEEQGTGRSPVPASPRRLIPNTLGKATQDSEQDDAKMPTKRAGACRGGGRGVPRCRWPRCPAPPPAARPARPLRVGHPRRGTGQRGQALSSASPHQSQITFQKRRFYSQQHGPGSPLNGKERDATALAVGLPNQKQLLSQRQKRVSAMRRAGWLCLAAL